MKHEISLIAEILAAHKAEVALTCIWLDMWGEIGCRTHATRAPGTELAWILQWWLLLVH
jgi:hypothetical protein